MCFGSVIHSSPSSCCWQSKKAVTEVRPQGACSRLSFPRLGAVSLQRGAGCPSCRDVRVSGWLVLWFVKLWPQVSAVSSACLLLARTCLPSEMLPLQVSESLLPAPLVLLFGGTVGWVRAKYPPSKHSSLLFLLSITACSCEQIIQALPTRASDKNCASKWVLQLSETTRLPRWCGERGERLAACAVWIPCCFRSVGLFVETLHVADGSAVWLPWLSLK